MLPAPNKNYLLAIVIAQLLFGVMLFISLCVHVGNDISPNLDMGVGGRLGFIYFLYCLGFLAYWAYLLTISLKHKYSLDTWYMLKYLTFTNIILNWVMTFVISGVQTQLTRAIPIELQNSAFTSSGAAALAAVIISMIIASAYLFLITFWKQALLDAQYDQEPTQPNDLSTATSIPNEQQQFYQGGAGYQAQSSEAYGTDTHTF